MKGVSQLNKWARDLKKRGRGCIYTPHSQSQPLSANSTFFVLTGRAGRCDRTRPVGGKSRFEKQRRWVTGRADESDQGWPDASGHSKPFLEPFCTLTGLGHSGIRSNRLSVRSQTLALLTVERATCASGQASHSVRSWGCISLQFTTLTGRVRSR
jgi:ABC-type sugar transport system ATPase subunit